MSHTAGDSQGAVDPVEVSRDAVTLDRETEIRDEGVVVTYRLTADSEEAVAATVADAIPSTLPTDEAGFHPDNQPYDWTLDGRELAFETVVPTEGERIVVFGIAHEADEDDDIAFDDPELTEVSAVNPAVADEDMDVTLPDVDEPDRADAIAEVIQGSGEPPASADGGENAAEASSAEIEAALEGLSEDEASTDQPPMDVGGPAEEDAGTIEDEADADEGEATELDVDEDATTDDPDPESAPPIEGSVVEALVIELQDGTVSDTEREALIEALGIEPATSDTESLDVRLSHVQSRMDDYAAYADALEEIIDEYGTADGFMAEITEQVSLVDDRVEDLHERIDDIEAELAELSETTADRDEQLAALDDTIAELRADVESVRKVRDTLLDAFGEADESD